MSAPFGCLILHGFTSSLDTVRALEPMAVRLGLPYRMPILRGHGTRPEDLRGVTHRDWYADGEAALLDLAREVDQVFVCALSMGGLVGLELAARHGDRIAQLVTISAALRIADPLIHLSPFISRFVKMWDSKSGSGYTDKTLAAKSTNYKRFATDALVSLHRYGKLVEGLLPSVQVPLLVIHARHDTVVKPVSANVIYERVGSKQKELRWFERCNHEMLQDCEAADVVRVIEEKLRSRMAAAAGAPPLRVSAG